MNYHAIIDRSGPVTLATRYAPVVLSILRIMAGLLLLEHGTQKLLGFPPPANGTGPEFLTLLWFAGIIEIVCGVLITIGLFTRPAAFVASGFAAFAYFLAHAPRTFFPALNGGDAAILMCFVFLYFVFAGAGPLSLDATLRRR